MLETFKQNIQEMQLQPSGGGAFEVIVDGELVYSKLDTGSFPEEQQIVDALQQRVA